MTNSQQAEVLFRQYLRVRECAPWIARYFIAYGDSWVQPSACLQRMNGLMGVW